MTTMGERIKAERKAQGLSRPKLAKAASIAPSTLSDIELGYSKTTTALHRIADALGLSPNWLESGKGGKYVVTRSVGGSPDIAEIRIALMFVARAMADSTPGAARQVADQLANLPDNWKDRPFVQGLIDTIRAELAQQAILPSPNPTVPAPDARKHP